MCSKTHRSRLTLMNIPRKIGGTNACEPGQARQARRALAFPRNTPGHAKFGLPGTLGENRWSDTRARALVRGKKKSPALVQNRDPNQGEVRYTSFISLAKDSRYYSYAQTRPLEDTSPLQFNDPRGSFHVEARD